MKKNIPLIVGAGSVFLVAIASIFLYLIARNGFNQLIYHHRDELHQTEKKIAEVRETLTAAEALVGQLNRENEVAIQLQNKFYANLENEKDIRKYLQRQIGAAEKKRIELTEKIAILERLLESDAPGPNGTQNHHKITPPKDSSKNELNLQSEPVRDWKNTRGAIMNATLIGVSGGTVHLKLSNGRVVNFPLENLSEGDQNYIRKRMAKPED